ncbi:chaperonin 10-like protein [Aspergillus carlsbadensis]|nr:chaperonin 10-like protein [Aspergillus carlsbadensis]
MDVAQASPPTLFSGHTAKDTNVSIIEADLPSTQRAIVTPEVGKALNMSLQTIPVREPVPGEVIVRTLYSGICCSDSIFSTGPQPGYPKHNHIAGHEGIGYIVKSRDPALVPSTERLYGVRYLAWSCESCTYCLRGLPTSCPFQLNTPKQIPGTFQEYVTVPSTVLVPLPETISGGGMDTALYAAALCSGSTALMSLRAASLSPGDVVIVVGALGAIGHLTGMIAKKVMRVKVIGVDLSSKVDRVSPQEVEGYCDVLLGAPESHEGSAWEEFHAALLSACAQLRSGNVSGVRRAAEAAIVTSSSIAAFQRLDEYVCDGGRIVCAGVPKGVNMVSLPLHRLIERSLYLTGNLMGGHQETLEVMEYIRTGQITPRITKVGLEEVPNQIQAMVNYQTVGKIVVCL